MLSGAIRAKVSGETLTARPGDTLRIPSNQVHSFESVGEEAARLLVVFPVHDPLSPEHSVYLEGAPPATDAIGDAG